MENLSREVVNIISNATKTTENSEYNGWWNKLLFLMQIYPNINIIYDAKIEKSYYSPVELTIYLNETSSAIFLHELTHMFHHLETNYYVPKNFEQLINISDKKYLIVDFAKLLKEHRSLAIKSTSSNPNEKIINLNFNDNQLLSETNMDNNMIEWNLDNLIQDILDALVCGKGFDEGITYIKDNNSLAIKSGKICGHGADYYMTSNSIYKELLANYSVLTLINPNYEYFTMLKIILGEPLVELLDKEVDKFFSSNIEKEENNNTNIEKVENNNPNIEKVENNNIRK